MMSTITIAGRYQLESRLGVGGMSTVQLALDRRLERHVAGNLLRTPDGGVKLADFGIAKATEQSSITQVGSVLGTAAYLAPEQARGEEAGPASDLYALGVVTYQLVSGRLPYEATSLTELALKQQQEAPAMLDALV